MSALLVQYRGRMPLYCTYEMMRNQWPLSGHMEETRLMEQIWLVPRCFFVRKTQLRIALLCAQIPGVQG